MEATLVKMLVGKGLKETIVSNLITRLGLDGEDPDDLKYITIEGMQKAGIEPGLITKIVDKLSLNQDPKNKGDEDEGENLSGNDLLIGILAKQAGVDVAALRNPIKSVKEAFRRVPSATKEARDAIIVYLDKSGVLAIAFKDDEIDIDLTVTLAGKLDANGANNLILNGLVSGDDFYEFRPPTIEALWPSKNDGAKFWFSPFSGQQLTIVAALKSATDDAGNNFGPIVFISDEGEALNRIGCLRWMVVNGKLSVGSAMDRRKAIGYFSGPKVSEDISVDAAAWKRLKKDQNSYRDFVYHEATSHPPNPVVRMRKSLTMEELARASRPDSPGGGRY